MTKLRLAIVGCGAQTEINHLQTVAMSAYVDLAMLVDKDEARARTLAAKTGSPAVTGDYRRIVGHVDAALVALPNHLHAPVAIDLMRSGIHVLVEKPMALTSIECDEMIRTSQASGTVLAVGLDFRFMNQARFVKQMLAEDLLGEIQSFDIRMGHNLQGYKVRTDHLVRRAVGGGGVLIDLGVHALDLVLWWLGECELVKYCDDARGGVEANCELHLRSMDGAAGFVEASRVRRLRNTCIVHGARASLEVGIWNPNGEIRLTMQNQDEALLGRVGAQGEMWRDVYERQLGDFVGAIRTRREPLVPGREGKRSVELIQRCYASRTLMWEPWMESPEEERSEMSGERTKVHGS